MEVKMEFTEKQKRNAKLIAKASFIYQNLFLEGKKYPEQFENGYTALIRFIKFYAYERQGAAAAYPEIAEKVITEIFNEKTWNAPSISDARKCWKLYRKIAKRDYNNLKLNEARNPMNSKQGIIRRLAQKKVSNIASCTSDLVKKGETKEAHNFLKNIKGIGDKISSFYIRDICYFTGIPEKEIQDIYLLQPIDTWLGQVVNIISNGVKMSQKEQQKFIVGLCGNEISGIEFNQGAWFLGSQIAGDYDTFKRVVSDTKKLKEKIQSLIQNEERIIQVYNEFLNQI